MSTRPDHNAGKIELGRIDHVAVVVRDLEACISRYEQFGYEITQREELDGPVQVAMMHPGKGDQPGFEFMCPQTDQGPLADFLAESGEGVHHIAFRVSDVASSLEALEADGIRCIDHVPRQAVGAGRIGFVGEHCGMLVQLVDRPEGYLSDRES